MQSFTPMQEAAIYTQGADILVSAAAGSGKTAVLVERIINKITREVEPCDVDKLLVVTFTEAAAQEMRRRVSRRLNEMLRDNPLDSNLKRQLALLPSAPISTMHSYCRRLITENTNFLDINPGFKVADASEAVILKQEALEDVLEVEYAQNETEGFSALARIYSGKYADTPLRELVFKVYEFIFASARAVERIGDYNVMFEEAARLVFSKTAWAALFAEMIKTSLEYAYFELENAMNTCSMPGGPYAYLSAIEVDLAEVETLIKYADNLEENWKQFGAFEFMSTKLKSVKKTDNADEELINAVKNARAAAKNEIRKLQKRYFAKTTPDKHKQRIAAAKPVIEALCELTLKFVQRYQIVKRERDLLDFNDLEQYAIKVLYNEAGSEISNIAKEKRDFFEEVLTDEYQDQNAAQELILTAIAGRGKRFMVGDIKQSIYKFRQAKPQIFIDKYNTYAKYERGTAEREIVINLNMNFRSRKNVTDTINYMFFQIMSSKTGEVDYNEDAALIPGADNSNADIEDTTEVYILKTDEPDEDASADLTKTEKEAHFIARKIKAMVCGKDAQRVFDKNTGESRPSAYGDIAVLAVSVKDIGGVYTDVFKKYDIPLYVNAGGGCFDTLEIMVMLAVLNIIDNPKQDICLISVLHSPIYDVTCDELALIRTSSNEGAFYDSVCKFIENNEQTNEIVIKLNTFMSDFEEFRRLSVFTSITELLWLIYEKTHYYEYAGAMPGGSVRQANLRALCEYAAAFEETQLLGMFNFLKYLERVQTSGGELQEASMLAENADAVRLLTIHSSKGLEFPIVFVAALHKRFAGVTGGESIIMDSDLGFGIDYTDLTHNIKYPTLLKAALAHKAHKEDLSERLRVLYVALTRARDKLILTGVLPKNAQDTSKWQAAANKADAQLSSHYIYKSKCFLDLIMPAVLRMGSDNGLPYADCKIALTYGSVYEKIQDNDIEEKEITVCDASVSEEGEAADINVKLGWVYPNEAATRLPSKVSVSEIKRLYQEEHAGDFTAKYFERDIEFKKPQFKAEAESAANIGTAVHTVLERLDFSRDLSKADISAFICSLAGNGLIPEKIAAKINADSIYAFVCSNLCLRIRNSKRVMREVPFVLMHKPEEIYLNTEAKDEKLLTHGIIDLYFEEDEGIVIVDYKSDYITPQNKQKIISRYIPQLKVYKNAVEKTEALPIKEVCLYLLSINEEYVIDSKLLTNY